MTKNRKTSDIYRFNGISGLKSVETTKFKTLVDRLLAKQANPEDPDEKRWVARWLKRFQQKLAKKEKAREQRKTDSSKQQRKQRSVSGFDAIETPASDAR